MSIENILENINIIYQRKTLLNNLLDNIIFNKISDIIENINVEYKGVTIKIEDSEYGDEPQFSFYSTKCNDTDAYITKNGIEHYS